MDHLRYQQAEYRISIYGRSKKEWDQLADWIVDHELYSPHNRWLIQVPRLYGMYQSSRSLRTFGEMLDNIFVPLFEVTNDPSSHPKLHLMLQQVVGFDSVDDESKAEEPLFTPDTPADEPDQWTEGNPHYCYYTYYLYANLYVLNQMRAAQGLSSFCFRPHAGEAGELNHLHGAYLTARGINHGINLRKSPSLQYLYYLTQIGLALSPLSNNALFLTLSKSPFNEFFSVGLNVSLSTDDPLMFHHTREPLMEEYTIAKQVWKLSSVDLAEIARNSVLQSSFEPCVKAFWIGSTYRQRGPAGNDIHRTNVPNLRMEFREVALRDELRAVYESYDVTLLGRPQLSPSMKPITSYIAAARHAASTSAQAEAPQPAQGAIGHGDKISNGANGPAAPPQARTAGSYQRYDGPFAAEFKLDESRRSAYSPTRKRWPEPETAPETAPQPPQPAQPPQLPPAIAVGASGSDASNTRTGREREAAQAGWQPRDRVRERGGMHRASSSASLTAEGSRHSQSDDIHARLDEQQRQLAQSQALAAAAESRAQSAMVMNRLLLLVAVGCAATAVFAVTRSK